ncbi:hypothetical protein K0U07_01190 [bacterium]|nr:hypothetical protein [bacterium]
MDNIGRPISRVEPALPAAEDVAGGGGGVGQVVTDVAVAAMPVALHVPAEERLVVLLTAKELEARAKLMDVFQGIKGDPVQLALEVLAGFKYMEGGKYPYNIDGLDESHIFDLFNLVRGDLEGFYEAFISNGLVHCIQDYVDQEAADWVDTELRIKGLIRLVLFPEREEVSQIGRDFIPMFAGAFKNDMPLLSLLLRQKSFDIANDDGR